ncbi:hypothetical protein TVAG_488980 [Trichomonas vaginalis G3]|uniref:Uncharacterized protein n=1 Tax=Trichomonas vaginalis (strain ATCC PRA-98 / G3) TaxID=412133 RepID=A2FL70_TRIV3|nr:spectrin binding [Trichomonas vaginalis G3]EAX94359.1 hypothetical protein TVAG_488980 [Trichomonas vaginalis G3]KAI5536478.1 spectrin binding [Trichomonas vaginalis G3]|eukprot:XP_001307289.1 hypothetical protein [Trichomonas vaginalis G3]
MSQELSINHQYIASHISDFIEDGKLFVVFDKQDILKIMEFGYFYYDEFINLLKQSSPTMDATDLYIYTRCANIYIDNCKDAVTFLKSLRRYLKMELFNDVIDILYKCQTQGSSGETNSESQANDQEVQLLKSQIQKKDEKIAQFMEEIDKLQKDIQIKETSINQSGEENNKLKNDIRAKTTLIDQINEENGKIKRAIQSKDAQNNQIKEENDRLKRDIQNKETTINQITEENSNLKRELQEKEVIVNAHNE